MLSVVWFVFAIVASASAVFFGLATARNPYNDITKAYTTMFFLGSFVVAAVFWVLFGLARDRSPQGEDDWTRPPTDRR